MEGSLHDLSVVVSLLTRTLDPYFDGETDSEEWRTWESKFKSVRRVICERVNSTLDLYEARADGKGSSLRGSMLLDMMETDFARFGIHRTADGKLYTYEASTGAARDDGETNRAGAGR